MSAKVSNQSRKSAMIVQIVLGFALLYYCTASYMQSNLSTLILLGPLCITTLVRVCWKIRTILLEKKIQITLKLKNEKLEAIFLDFEFQILPS